MPLNTLTGIVAIAAGQNHGLALTSGGVVWSWGANSSGQLGDGTTTSHSTPAPISGLTNVVAVSAGNGFSVALAGDGKLWTWGANGSGQLGTGDTSGRLSPVNVLSGVAKVVAGGSHMVAVKTDGTAWTWGANGSGQLGDGTTTSNSTPTATSLSSVGWIAAGSTHTLAQLTTGEIYAWGGNNLGQLGDGTTTDRHSPTQLTSLSAVAALGTGQSHTLAALSGGSVKAWGWNTYGQVGDGTTSTSRSSPTAVSGPTSAFAVAGGDHHSLAMETDGSIWAWGQNYWGQLGDGTITDHPSPIKIRDGGAWLVTTPTLSPAGGSYTAVQSVTVSVLTAGATIRYTTNGSEPTESDSVVASGGAVSVDQSLTLKAKAWKSGMAPSATAAEVYTLTVATPSITPSTGTYDTPQTATVSCSVSGATIRYTTDGVDPTTSDTVIASGGTVSVDVSQTLKAKAWKSGWTDSAVASKVYTLMVGTPTLNPGGGSYSPGQQITVNTTTPSAELHYTTNGLEPTTGDATVAAGGTVTLSGSVTLKVKGFRTGWTPSGTGLASYYVVEGTVASPSLDPAPGSYSSAQTVSMSTTTSGALVRYTLDGSVPDTSSPAYSSPITVAATQTVSARAFKVGWTPSSTTSGTYTIASGEAAPPVLSPDGGVFATGKAVTVTTAETGVTMRYTTSGLDPTDTDPTIASGAQVVLDRSLRLKVRAWKSGLDPSPVSVGDYEIVGAVTAGHGDTFVLKADGTVSSWGQNGNGELGDGTTTQRNTPGSVSNLTDVVAVAAGQYHALALKADHTVWAWGYNFAGQVGDGTSGSSADRTTPVQVLTASGSLTDVVAISAGAQHSMALKSDGTVWTWGLGLDGELGDGLSQSHSRATLVPGLTGVTAIAARGYHCMALATDGAATGSLWVWGYNGQGELGDGSTTDRSRPVKVADDVKSMAGGVYHTFVVKSDGSVWAAGLNDHGQLGDATTTTPRLDFEAVVEGLEDPIRLSASGLHSVVLAADGTVWATGLNNLGQLGDGTRVDKSSPIRAVLLHDAVDVTAGQFVQSIYYGSIGHSVALTSDGQVWTWGSNYYGQLGTGGGINDAAYRPRPVEGFSAADQSWPLGDPDGDGLTTEEELALGTDPFNADTNGDGVLDSVAVRSGISATDLDTDGDGVSNAEELAQGTDPIRADTDGDGVADGSDCFPLDPSRSSCPVPQQGDQTPPTITLTEPTGATLVGSVP